MQSKQVFQFGLVLSLVSSAQLSLQADDGWDKPVFQITEENDSGLSDRHYTQGLRLNWLSRDHGEANWLTRSLKPVGFSLDRWKWGLEAGQFMFTPEQITNKNLIPSDRPYGGWLYGGFIYQPRGLTPGGTPVMETFRLQAGVAGPESHADDAQILWHHIWGFDRPNGWRHQIQTEPGLQLNYDRRYRYATDGAWSVQALPEGGVNLGNIRMDGHLGATFRAGYNIPNEFGTEGSKPGWDCGFYVFAGAYGRAVLIDIFLDGNNFTSSHHVRKEHFVGEAHFGGAFTFRHFELSLMHVQRTKEFVAQNEADGFTSLTLSAKF